MAKSQQTYFKKQREKERAKRKQEKLEKKELRRENESAMPEIDWSSAPENKTLTQEEEAQKQKNKANNLNN